jgi:2-polyprenyl-6-methoxyphenol hydroxylase-like FAD-dependent oxidoreductase
MTHTPTALIIGGGIAGPAAAMALQQAGIDSVIYEAHPTGAEGIDVFLTLGSNEGRIAVPPRARCRDGEPCLPSVA